MPQFEPSNSETWVTLALAGRVAGSMRETVVHRYDLDLVGGVIHHRMVGAVMALRHFQRPRADGEAEHLVAEANAEDRRAAARAAPWIVGTAYLPVSAGSPGPLERNTPSGFSARISSAEVVAGTTVTAQPQIAEQPQNVALDAVIDGDDAIPGRLAAGHSRLRASSSSGPSRSAAPTVTEGTRSMPSMPGQALASASSAARSNSPAGSWAMTALGMPSRRIIAVSARVSIPVRPMIPRDFSQASSRRVARKLEGVGDVGAEDRAARAGGGGEIGGLDVLLVRPDDADMGEGEGDDLPGVGGIGEDLLVAGHRGVEADLADGGAGRADAEAFEDQAVGEDEQRGRLAGGPSAAGGRRAPGPGAVRIAFDMGLWLSAAGRRASSRSVDGHGAQASWPTRFPMRDT